MTPLSLICLFGKKMLRDRQVLTALLSENHTPLQKGNMRRCSWQDIFPSRVWYCSTLGFTIFPHSPQKSHSCSLSPLAHALEVPLIPRVSNLLSSAQWMVCASISADGSAHTLTTLPHSSQPSQEPVESPRIVFPCVCFVWAIPSSLLCAHTKTANTISRQAPPANSVPLCTVSKPVHFTPFFHSG